MRGRRGQFRKSNDILPIINVSKIVLGILIVISAIIFIFSSINTKNKLSKLAEKSTKPDNYGNSSLSDTDTDININNNTLSDIIDNEIQKQTEQPVQSIAEETSSTINMAFTGDITCQNSIYKDAYNSDTDSYDFSYIFEDIKYNIQTADVAIRKPRNYIFR